MSPPEGPGLFGGPVGPAPVPAPIRRVAEALPSQVRLGTSSWSFPGWSGLVWDRPADKRTLSRHGLGAYSQHPLLRAVGVDRSYYAPVPAAVFRDYAAQVPDGFRFLVKAHEALTIARYPRHPRYGEHAGRDNPRFLDPTWATEQVVGPTVEGLGDKLGVLLFQLPPTPAQRVGGAQAFAERLHAFLGALPRGPRYGVEIRTPALLGPAYARALTEHGAVHAYVSHPRMPPIPAQMKAVPGGARHGLVVRWMLRPDLDYEGAKGRFAPFDALAAPDPEARGAIARLVRLAVDRGKDVIVIVNNKAEGSAPRSVIALAEAVVEDA